MKPLIPPHSYCDPATLVAERENIFLRQWIFAGTTQQLANHEDYRRIEIAGISVVLQNFHGQIKAFNNVCTHRFARLQSEVAGNRQLKCPYHGWIFNGEGLPYGIPRKPLIAEISPETLCQYRLGRWHVRTVGTLIFIKKEQGNEPLAADDLDRQCGDFATSLAEFASACGELVENTDYVVKANWKLIVENTLEGYHVDCVHPNTIRKLGMSGLHKVTKGGVPEEPEDPANRKGSYFTFSGQNSSVTSPINSDVAARMDRTYKFLANRPARLNGYRHFYFFPAFVLASTRGESFSIQRILPIDEKTTQLTSFLFATNGVGELSKMEAALKKQFYQSAADFVRAIFAEDAGICEEVQHAVGYAQGTGVLSDEEERICAFHESYAAAMREPSRPVRACIGTHAGRGNRVESQSPQLLQT